MDYKELEKVVIQKKKMGNKAMRIMDFVTKLCNYLNTNRVSLDATYALARNDIPRFGNEKVISKNYFKKICNDTWLVVKDSDNVTWIDISIVKGMPK